MDYTACLRRGYRAGMTDAVARALFDPIADAYLARDGVDMGPLFGSEGLRIRGKVFAFVGHRGDLIAKLPEERVTELEASGQAERMVMRERMLREWVIVGVERGELWWPIVDEAFAFVDAITP